MGFGTTFAMLSFLFIFAGMTMFVIQVQEAVAVSANAIRDQNTESLEATNQDLSITASTTGTAVETNWTITYDDEFQEGTLNNVELNGDAVQGINTLSGTYTTEIYNTGYSSNYTTLSWTSIEPVPSFVAFQVRSANTTLAVQAAQFIGPDGTAASFYTTPGTTLNTTHNADSYVQLRATLDATAAVPELQDITLGIVRLTDSATLTVENTGTEKLNAEQTDIYVDGIRLLREETNRVYDLEIQQDERLWNPGEELTLTIFTSTPATIMVNNEFAQDTTTV